ncbi:FecR family protein [Patescibacteria group bacterium]|nr:FecR family protein [Patescibacteria group bacterium]
MIKIEKGFAGVILIFLIVVVALILAGLYFFNKTVQSPQDKGTTATGSNNEVQVYQETTPFDPESLTQVDQVTKSQDGVVIPPKSRVNLAVPSYCLDGGKGLPDPEEVWPQLYSYQKVDMPLFNEITDYLDSHSDAEQSMAQEVIWGLAPDSQTKFADFTDEEKQFLLQVDSKAEEKIDSYQYYQHISVARYQFPEQTPTKLVPQPIPGSGLYAKNTDYGGYSQDFVEVYNPTDQPQTLSLKNSSGEVLVAVPMFWTMTVDIDNIRQQNGITSFHLIKNALAAGTEHISSYDIFGGHDFSLGPDGRLSTGPSGSADILYPDGTKIEVPPNTVYYPDDYDPKTGNFGLPDAPWSRAWLKIKEPARYQRLMHSGVGGMGIRG